MDIVEKIRSGNVRFVSRLIRNIEDQQPRAKEAIKAIFPYTGNAYVIGFTGSPGVGKSTLTDSLITSFRNQGKKIGVLAVDPTSPFTGGALLGDRVRMQKHVEDPGVYIRSLATRGALGGLSEAVDDAVHILDAMGNNIIIIETVGTGQSEVDIMNNAHSIVLVLTPGLGDEVQTIKAGVIEIADLFVINKADQPGSDKLLNALSKALDMGEDKGTAWRPPILRVENLVDQAAFSRRVDQLRDKLIEHYTMLKDKQLLKGREKRKALVQLQNALKSAILDPIMSKLYESEQLEDILRDIVAKNIDPYSAAERLRNGFGQRVD